MMMLSFNNFFPSRVGTFISDRTVDFSLNKEEPQFNPEQASVVRSQVGLENPRPFNIQQVHANTIVTVREESAPLQKADGLITRLKNVPLVIRTADCLPVFFYDQKQEVIGLVHAGWRGTRERIALKAVEKMQEEFRTDVSDLLVAFGPSIRSCCYEVGAEFAQYFPEEVAQKKDAYYFDLCAANRNQLKTLQIKEAQVHDCRICTCCNTDLFSYRREGPEAGRMISLMVLKSE